MRNLAKTWFLLVAFSVLQCGSAVALPDQKVSELIRWSNQETILPRLQAIEQYTGGYADFSVELPIHGKGHYFNVFLDQDNRVDSEAISLNGVGTSINFQVPLLDTSENLILSIWGEAVLTDFLEASLIQKTEQVKWYEGNDYNYKVRVDIQESGRDVSISLLSKRFPLAKRLEIDDWCAISGHAEFCEMNRDFILQQMNSED